jgi:ABC-type uncharacterized transport system substrate-binding protein
MMKHLALMILVLVNLPSAWAHPHAWINLTSDFLINEQGEVYELRQRWIFDTLYSAVTLSELGDQPGSEALAKQGQSMVTNLTPVNFYTHLMIDQNALAIGTPEHWHLSRLNTNQGELLMLEMHFALTPVSLADAPITWSVYDPTFYVSMRHDTLQQVRIYNHSSLECEPILHEPDPDSDILSYAASLDKTQTDSTGLGQLFAQTVTIRCF